jgi:hypothetical protein
VSTLAPEIVSPVNFASCFLAEGIAARQPGSREALGVNLCQSRAEPRKSLFRARKGVDLFGGLRYVPTLCENRVATV